MVGDASGKAKQEWMLKTSWVGGKDGKDAFVGRSW
jgi:hypothetical protein